MASIDNMVQGPEFEGLSTIEWCLRRVRHSYPENIVPTEIFYHKDSPEEWLKFNNINQCIAGA